MIMTYAVGLLAIISFSTYSVLSADAGRSDTFEFPQLPSASALRTITAMRTAAEIQNSRKSFSRVKVKA